MAAMDALTVQNASATSPAKELLGGKYILDAVATFGGGSVKVQQLGRDNTTWMDVPNSTLTANGATQALFIPPGQYRIGCWHERLPGEQRDVTLTPDQRTPVTLKLSVNLLPAKP